MRQKIPALIISLLAAIYFANAINKALPVEPRQAHAQLPGNAKQQGAGGGL